MKDKIKNILWPYYKKTRNFFLFPSEFLKYYRSQQLTNVQKQFIKELSFFKPNVETVPEEGIVLVQYLKDYEYTIKFAAAVKTYAQKNKLRVYFYDVNWIKWIGWGNKLEPIFNRYFTSSNLKIHRAFGEKIIFKTEDKFHDQQFIKEQFKKIRNNLKTPEDVLHLKIENILVGDLIYDTYLRYFNEPTLIDISENLLKVIEVSLNIFYGFKETLKKHNIKALFNSYNAYIEHGIPARMCLAKKIKVLTFGSYSYVIQEATLDFPYHTINHSLFDPNKSISTEDIKRAEEIFTSRFTGVIDEATRYMKTSAFSDKPISEELKKQFAGSKRNVVIYTHDFYDSPHINRCLQFPDLYQFLKQTLDALKEATGSNFYIKTHPNSYGDSKERTIALVNSYHIKHFHILDDSVSNIHIINLKPDLIVTARGTVGVEMSHFKIPVVALYDNIYINFNFVHSCKDVSSFFRIIRGEEQTQIDFDVQKIYSFYYQAYMEKVPPAKDNAILKLATKTGDNHSDTYLSNLLNNGFSKWKKDLFLYFETAINQLEK